MPTIEIMKLKPAEELGPVLTSRGLGAALRERVESALAAGEEITIDLAGVETMSPSFADELFAKIDPRLVERGRVRFVHVPATVKPLVRFLAGNRRHEFA